MQNGTKLVAVVIIRRHRGPGLRSTTVEGRVLSRTGTPMVVQHRENERVRVLH